MSRDPLAVLRLAASMAEYGVPQAEVDEAIAQVEALVEAARDVLDSPSDRSVAGLFGQLHVSLQPFTPGQDSEGAA